MSNTIKSIDSLVTQIVNRLDRNDNPDKKTDGVIKKDEWNKFAAGKGKQVTVGIHTSKAEKSVKYYLGQQRKTKNGQRDLAQSWLDKLMNEDVETMAKKLKEDKKAAEASAKKAQYIQIQSAESAKESDLVKSLKQQDDERNKQFAINKFIDNTAEEKADIKNLMCQEVSRRGLPDDAAKKIDYEYWVDKIYNVSKQYKVQPTLIVAIMAQESNGCFTKAVDAAAGHGPMGITTIAVKDFFTEEAGWYPIYEALDEELLTDILYKKNNGKIVKGADGKPVLNYPSAKDLRDACAKDEEFGIKVGLLCYEMNYAKEVARKIFNMSSKANPSAQQVSSAINLIKSGTLNLTRTENQRLMANAARNYNGNKNTYKSGKYKGRVVKDVYQEQVLDSLKFNNYRFEQDYIINKKTA